QARREPGVDLHQVEMSGPRRQLVGERAQPGTDLEHGRAGPELRGVDDPPRDCRVAQEVLAPALARAEPGGGQRRARLPARPHPVAASASAVVSTSMSTSASCRLAATSGSASAASGCWLRYARSAVLKPLKLKSKRLRLRVARGKRIAFGSPSRARRSMTGPPG